MLFEAKEMRETVQRVTASARIDGERVLLGYSSGLIRETRFVELNHPSFSASGEPDLADAQLAGAITVLEIIEVEGRQVVVAGAVDGSAGAWELSDWSTVGRWNLFASPVSHLACLWDSNAEPNATTTISQGYTLAFISSNSPVALISLSLPPTPSTSSLPASPRPPPPHTLLSTLLFVLPGTASPVSSISISSPPDPSAAEILVIYEQGLARACHLESRELRRSMDRRTARGVLKEREKAWRTWFGGEEGGEEERGVERGLGDPILLLDLRLSLEAALRTLPWSAESKRSNLLLSRKSHLTQTDGADTPDTLNNGFASHSPASASTGGQLGLVKMLLSNLVTWGLDEGMDELLSEHLGVERPVNGLVAGVVSSSALSFPVDNSSIAVWSISPLATAQRLLQIVCLLRVFLNFPETERYASQIIVFYASFLQDAVGESFAFPSLDVLADYWLDKSNEVQQAARSLFGTYLAASSDARVLALVERWQDLLPSRQSEGSGLYGSADQALLLTGLVATERYKLLSAAVLKDIALSVGLYLDDDSHPYHQSIATELCSRGFNIWQHYLEAMSLVRQLFGLATGRNPSTPNELRGLARSATLHVAGVNTPLFITTLLHDILSAPSLTHRNATLKLLGFMIRKKPLVLYTSLPRIAEAVVKSLDPTVTHLRETVHQAATVILNELVRTYPSIDFHHKSQRLAVGTHEGSTIIYDLKTATRLYVLEGHTRPVTALSWSPDGHRLVSVSLEESKAVVWKVGLGILSMFMPGAPPRQGSGAATQPFKTFEFHVGDEAHMTNAATLEWVVFDWPAERTARLRIRETALNFGT
ncbi:hypothetical protein BCR35DRAFT_280286 [Leucosporidium creatinivorum]|uniref:Uncharacterized protein n=1 Tax=Leucosporidium creatinivorum TaxID=106004 RepID=A0A1Y2EZA4_9BASI|nr:hypothetical protein BCR35DRAFT_280286 [Leucosporidium creatinivorum]